ncbi:cytochrome c oxidase assembly factor Coa1 family protein [Chelativorans sp. AA-79]|uniref:cytochrome c oxidase assembly factor Coa1 family protein n=1 Tax=Chelativorans sp. AA-79 TaxID=3028735 RepID=UPI0023F7B98E|nr:cytochrome c oxidase assembly factor Coa1 family protein [Chelativorans sp. AA-79]WEX07858.1 cytochrome c oxidase assembly factor Coa1 family protein [Chelativorans sp. AA-79]
MASQPLNEPAEIPAELDRWNWGAFLLNWIWGIGNSVFIALLMFVPLVNIVMIFVLGAQGSRWAWRNRVWRDAEHFRRVQRKWAIAGLIAWIAVIGLCAFAVMSFPLALKNSVAYRMTMETVRDDAGVKAMLGDGIEPAFWVSGGINMQADGGGAAALSIPITGSKGSGRVISQALRTGGVWELRLVVVRIDGLDSPLVLKNTGNLPIPNAPLDL